jgi:E-phenylitaconyl-CoA hydratase
MANPAEIDNAVDELISSLDLESAERRPGVVVGRRGHLAYVLLDRPERGNAFNRAMSTTLGGIWPELDADPEVRVIVLGTTTTRFFCTGRDVTEVDQTGTIGIDLPLERAVSLTNRQMKIWTPVVCAVEGKTVGGGLHFIVDADIVVAGDTATFMDTHVDLGFVGALENLGVALKAGIGSALYMTLLGRAAIMNAQTALAQGLVQEVVPAGTALTRAVELATIISKASPVTVQRSLEAIWGIANSATYEEALRQGWLLIRRNWDHPDSLEGPAAWAQKREPVWRVP